MRTITSAVTAFLFAVTVSAQSGTARFSNGFIKTTDGVRIHYIEAGSGPALLFIPGFTGAAEFWETQVRVFSASHRSVAMDPRSQGDSEKTYDGNFTDRRAQDIRDIVSFLHLGPVVIVAWSRAVSETLSYVNQFGSDAIRGVSSSMDQSCGRRVRKRWSTLPRKQRPYKKIDGTTPTSLREECSSGRIQRSSTSASCANLKTPTAVAVALEADFVQFDCRTALKKLNRPVLFASQGDTPTAQAKVVLAEVPTARIETFPGSGHGLFLDDPERFNAVLTSFIGSLSKN
jgi:non-heme chloroperoxidase